MQAGRRLRHGDAEQRLDFMSGSKPRRCHAPVRAMENNLIFCSRLFLSVAAASIIFAAMPAQAAPVVQKLDHTAIAHALSERPDDAMLNFLIGLAYESTAASLTESRELARVGYIMALRQDGDLWQASFQLGLMALEDGDPFAAQRHLMTAALNAPAELRVFRTLARAAYCAGDIELAAAAIEKANALSADENADFLLVENSVDYLLTSALIAAAQNDKKGFELFAGRLPPKMRDAVTNRMADPRQVMPVEAAVAPVAATDGDQVGGKRMALVDVIIIRRDEDTSTSTGINLLDSLSIQLGGNLINHSWTRSRNPSNSALLINAFSANQSLTLSVPAVTFSLNLANAQGNNSRIEGRPTLLIYDEVPAKFFDGETLTFSTTGQLNSSAQTREVGLALSVKPKFLGDEVVNLTVTVTLETFLPIVTTGTFLESVQTTKSSTEVAADLRFGQTMLVSSGAMTQVTRSRSKTPFLADIPVLGKLFSTKFKDQKTNELLVLLSLRPVLGEAVQRGVNTERRFVDRLRTRLFPDLNESARLAPETRQMFYRIENPAHTGTESYIAPMIDPAALKELMVRS